MTIIIYCVLISGDITIKNKTDKLPVFIVSYRRKFILGKDDIFLELEKASRL